MPDVTVQVVLPTELAREAEQAGLLAPAVIEALLREAIRRRYAEEFFEAADKLAALKIPPMTPEELEAEIRAAREAQRSTRARRG